MVHSNEEIVSAFFFCFFLFFFSFSFFLSSSFFFIRWDHAARPFLPSLRIARCSTATKEIDFQFDRRKDSSGDPRVLANANSHRGIRYRPKISRLCQRIPMGFAHAWSGCQDDRRPVVRQFFPPQIQSDERPRTSFDFARSLKSAGGERKLLITMTCRSRLDFRRANFGFEYSPDDGQAR